MGRLSRELFVGAAAGKAFVLGEWEEEALHDALPDDALKGEEEEGGRDAAEEEEQLHLLKPNVVGDYAGALEEGRDALGAEEGEPAKAKLGTLRGVYTPVISSMWGVLIFVRFAVLVGYCGWVISVGFVIMSAFAQVLTTLSLCAVLSNSTNYSGGSFGILKRNLGGEMAGVICLLYYLGMTTLASVELLGSVQAIGFIVQAASSDGGTTATGSLYWDQVAIGGPILLFIALLRAYRVHIVQGFTILILVVVAIAYFFGFLGIFLSLGSWEGGLGDVDGFTGMNAETFLDNAFSNLTRPSYSDEYLEDVVGANPSEVGEAAIASVSSAVGIIFPMFLGIFQGANKAAELKTPNRSIFKGTLLAISTSTVVYSMFILLLATIAERDLLKSDFVIFSKITFPTQYIGLVGTMMVGIGACSSLLEMGPTILQAVAQDGLFSFLPRLGLHERSSQGEPVNAVIVSLTINFFLLFTPSSMFETLAVVVTMFFLQAYGHMHASLLLNEAQKHSGWRPTFRYYHWSTALIGMITTIVLMFYINWAEALITILVALVLLLVAKIVEEPRRKGLGTRALATGRVLRFLLDDDLITHRQVLLGEKGLISDEGEYWEPQILCLVENPRADDKKAEHLKLLHLSAQFSGAGMLTQLVVVASMVRAKAGDVNVEKDRLKTQLNLFGLINSTNLRAFPHVAVTPETCSPGDGFLMMMQSVGIGNMRPNMVLMSWDDSKLLDVLYHGAISRKTVVVLKDSAPVHYKAPSSQASTVNLLSPNRSKALSININTANNNTVNKNTASESNAADNNHNNNTTGRNRDDEVGNSEASVDGSESDSDASVSASRSLSAEQALGDGNSVHHDVEIIPIGATEAIGGVIEVNRSGSGSNSSLFELQSDWRADVREIDNLESGFGVEYMNKWKRRKRTRLLQARTGTIDVWWIVKVGGLPVLLARLLLKHRVWRRCKIRVFATVERHEISDNVTMIAGVEVERLLKHMRVEATVEVIQIDPYTHAILRETEFDDNQNVVHDTFLDSEDAEHRSAFGGASPTFGEFGVGRVQRPTPSTPATPGSMFAHLRRDVADSEVSESSEDSEDNDPAAGAIEDGNAPSATEHAEKPRVEALELYRSLMNKYSKGAELLIINLPPPEEGATVEAYRSELRQLTVGFARVMFVHSPFDDQTIDRRFVD
ncbi:Solute carrier family 12 member 7 (Electroneutral potassium-chloride cotransporter 4) (K-Cl cotransporter 4) [Durusdinium trenchii]|uniref:Solute carrier family 12 member 7 (Electroneutral potassium-chloride cotransporter 4) (K-Cl cotransporter 4) n=1 Tax=Durusdinium trenchii TaxID=1381693 RepID=A0ABP0RTN9_9DINO